MSPQITCECGTTYEPYNSYCQKCNPKHWEDNFPNWTSRNFLIDTRIQRSQLGANNDYELIEWIDILDLEKISEFGVGSSGKVYSATWKSGPITNYHERTPGHYSSDNYGLFWKESAWARCGNHPVAIKVFKTFDLLLKEIENNLKLNCKVLGAELINRIYGITNLENEYGIVTNLYPCGNLRTVLPDVCFFDIIRILSHISAALHKIHENNYAHGNLHSRNILMRKNSLDHYEAVIGDFRLSKSLSPGAVGRKARAADIYAFGLIMSEIITIPSNQLRMYRAVLKQCRDAKPAELPTAKDLSLLFHYWYLFLLDGEDAEMHKNKLLKILTNVILFGR